VTEITVEFQQNTGPATPQRDDSESSTENKIDSDTKLLSTAAPTPPTILSTHTSAEIKLLWSAAKKQNNRISTPAAITYESTIVSTSQSSAEIFITPDRQKIFYSRHKITIESRQIGIKLLRGQHQHQQQQQQKHNSEQQNRTENKSKSVAKTDNYEDKNSRK
jgi:Fe2+ transport system protein B